jgi:hypothetical protein
MGRACANITVAVNAVYADQITKSILWLLVSEKCVQDRN